MELDNQTEEKVMEHSDRHADISNAKVHPWRKCGTGKHLVRISTDELLNPSSNICAGVRWLFRKKETASWLLKRTATWEETVEDYKAILSQRITGQKYNPKPMEDFREYYTLLSGD